MHVLFPFSGAEIGGSHAATFELARHLRDDMGLAVGFLLADGTPLAAETRAQGMPIIDTGELALAHRSLRGRRDPVETLKRFLPRLRLLRRERRGNLILHCNEITDLQSFGLAAKVAGIKLVYHHHALNRMNMPNRALVSMTDVAFCVSDICRRSLDFLPDDRLFKILNPIDVGRNFEPAHSGEARKRIFGALGIDHDRRLVGFVGNFWKRKRPEFFLSAAMHLKALVPECHFVMFGRKGDYSVADMQAMAATLGIADHVSLPGFMVPAEDNIAALDLLLAPAVNEPFGRTPVEAALLGVPYVATDDAGHAEIGRTWGGGLLQPLDASPEDFARAAMAVLRAPQDVVLPPDRRAAVAADFSPRAVAEHVYGIYQSL